MIVAYGGLVFTLGLLIVGMVAMAELYRLTARAGPSTSPATWR